MQDSPSFHQSVDYYHAFQLLYASPVWRPWLKGSVESLEFYREVLHHVCTYALKCDVNRGTIKLSPTTELLDDHNLDFSELHIDNPVLMTSLLGNQL